ncbi:hypothetical protein ACOME3_009686 [Neoechinorhynchus agilis]
MSCSNDFSFFEGAEKLLELWFTKADGQITSNNDLRRIPRRAIQRFLGDIGCKIVSFQRGTHTDAYVLSESSLFIGPRHLILKTCGAIAQLRCMSQVLRLASDYAGFDSVEDVFYSRKNFMRPELQPVPHRKFEEEVLYLENYFEGELVFQFGKYCENNWHLYTLNKSKSIIAPDQTIEIMMTQLDSPRSQAFRLNTPPHSSPHHPQIDNYLKPCKELRNIFDQCEVDEHLFEPCGYSCNAILADGLKYFTVHVTPEDGFSYASFECNASVALSQTCVESVVKCFQPVKFIITMFANEASECFGFVQNSEKKLNIPGYRVDDVSLCMVKNYIVAYLFFVQAGIS